VRSVLYMKYIYEIEKFITKNIFKPTDYHLLHDWALTETDLKNVLPVQLFTCILEMFQLVPILDHANGNLLSLVEPLDLLWNISFFTAVGIF